MMDNSYIADEMLARYILGEASPQERLSVLEWVSVSKENKNRLDELSLIWKESGKLSITTSVTTEAAWDRFKAQINKSGQSTRGEIRPLHWLKAAAIFLLLAGSGWFSWVNLHTTNPSTTVAVQTTPVNSSTEPATPVDAVKTPPANPQDTQVPSEKEPALATIERKKPITALPGKSEGTLHKSTRTKEFICNATPCPLEICIVQTIHCSNGQPASVATCNLLQPDQSGQLHYKAFDKTAGNCKATVSEIRIKRVTTGETIVLNNNSKPSTAQDLFNYLTGTSIADGDILAGIFETDCDNSCAENKLKIGNNFGHLILQ